MNALLELVSAKWSAAAATVASVAPKPTPASRSKATKSKAAPDKAAAYKIAYEEARATIAGQANSLKEVRDRAGIVASTVAATAALAVGLVLRGSDGTIALRSWGIAFVAIAGAGFVLATVSTIAVWWPTTVTLNMDAEMLVEKWVEGDPPMGEAEMHRWLAYYSGRHANVNRPNIDRRLKWFTGSLIGLALETGGLIAMLLDLKLSSGIVRGTVGLGPQL